MHRWKDSAEICLTNRDWRGAINAAGSEWDYVVQSYDQNNEPSGFL